MRSAEAERKVVQGQVCCTDVFDAHGDAARTADMDAPKALRRCTAVDFISYRHFQLYFRNAYNGHVFCCCKTASRIGGRCAVSKIPVCVHISRYRSAGYGGSCYVAGDEQIPCTNRKRLVGYCKGLVPGGRTVDGSNRCISAKSCIRREPQFEIADVARLPGASCARYHFRQCCSGIGRACLYAVQYIVGRALHDIGRCLSRAGVGDGGGR